MGILKSLFAMLILSFAFMNFAFVGSIYAADPFNPIGETCFREDGSIKPELADSPICQESQSVEDPITGTQGVILRVANLLAIAAGIMAVVILIVVGIQYMLSGGDSGKLNANRNAIIYTLIGIVVIIVSRKIIVFVINGIN